jgi:hypothetical protein
VINQALDLAYLREEKGDLRGAQRLYERLLPIIEKKLGPDDELTRTVRRDLERLARQTRRAPKP